MIHFASRFLLQPLVKLSFDKQSRTASPLPFNCEFVAALGFLISILGGAATSSMAVNRSLFW